jgi:N6-adenosine-specific RNA methylase IME4
MTLEEIRAEPVAQLADSEAHLHLWTTNGFLREAIDLVNAWGFEYKSCFVWMPAQQNSWVSFGSGSAPS